MKLSTIEKYTKIFNSAIQAKKPLREYCKENNLNWNSISSMFYTFKPKNDKEEELKQLFTKASKSTKKVDTNERAEVFYERDEDGKIIYYVYKVYKKNKPVLDGRLTREEMYLVYRLYTWYGDGLTARVVSRNFPNLSLPDFKRILRAFSIYKDNCPFPPHYIEEKSEEELRDIQLREKENSFLRKAEEDQIKNNEKLLKKYAAENIELKNNIQKYIDFAKLGIESKFSEQYNSKSTKNENTLVVVLSDLHVGAFNTPDGYMELPKYDKGEINRRLNKVITFINNAKYERLVILNLGDSVDSYKKETTRGGHELPGILTDKQISKLYLEVMMRFFNSIHNISNVQYYCVGESNHDGDVGWLNNLILANKLEKEFNIECFISDTPQLNFNVNEVSISALHGKDNYTQFKGFPLVINDKTENWFNNYYLNTDFPFKKKKIVVKGDLHQYAYTCAKSFDYMSCPSLYGSSKWIVSNFGKTPWGISYINIDSSNNVNTGIINE